MAKGAPAAAVSDQVPSLSIVIPAHNEARRIGPVLEQYATFFGRRAELLVVLNGCTDLTVDVVRQAQQRFPDTIVLIEVAEPIGKGGAIRRGFLQARGSSIGFVDADGSTAPAEFQRLLKLLDTADGVIGSRWMPGASVFNRTSRLRRVTSVGFVMVTKVLFHLPYHDTQCGAKWFRRAVITAINQRLHMHDMTFDVELLLLARAGGYRIREAPTVWTDQSSPVLVGTPWRLVRTSLAMLGSLLKLYARARREHLV
ncbi:MAG: glycosyltransferase [Candidatus Kerfeldbacteria bacterium]|nr:glycosyltransferase [Candidatus Kerfeldbacteria bacterium]